MRPLKATAGAVATTALMFVALPTSAAAAGTGLPQPELTVTPLGADTTQQSRPLTYGFAAAIPPGSLPSGTSPGLMWSINYGDGTPATACQGGRCSHTYPAPRSYQVTVTATDGTGSTSSVTRTVDAAYPAGHFHWASGRILDTRTGINTFPGNPIRPDSELTLNINGQLGDVPGNFTNNDIHTTAVVLNVTAVNPTESSFLTVHPSGTPRPITSNSNFVPGQTAAHLVTVPVGADGRIKIYNHVGTVDVVADLVGWYSTVGEDGYAPMQPSRLLDTRSGVGTSAAGQIQPLGSLCFKLPAGLGIPSDVDAVALNLTATNPSADGYLTATFDSQYRGVSSLNYSRGETVANQVIVPMQGHQVCLNNGGGAIDAIADIVGYYSAGAPGRFTPVTPARMLDTRVDNNPISGGDHRTVQIGGTNGALVNATAAVLNVTATEPDEPGHFIVYPGGNPVPGTSNVNFAAGQTVPNHVTTALGTDGTADVLNAHGYTHAIVDLFGYFTNP